MTKNRPYYGETGQPYLHASEPAPASAPESAPQPHQHDSNQASQNRTLFDHDEAVHEQESVQHASEDREVLTLQHCNPDPASDADYTHEDAEVDDFMSHFDRPSSSPEGYTRYHQQASRRRNNDPQAKISPFGHLGILGAIGDVIADSFLVDDQRNTSREPGKSEEMIGNFSTSSANIWLEREQILVANCRDVNGTHHETRLDLNDYLSNDNGAFKWQRDGNFKGSARRIVLNQDRTGLKAKLRAMDGRWRDASIKLDERISNDDGQLIFRDR